MFKKKSLTLKLLLFLISTDILETLTHYCFKRSAIPEANFQIQNLSDAFIFIRSTTSSPFLWMGLLSVLVTFIIWSTILSRIDLSVAVPVCSFSYIFIPIVSMIFLHETIDLMRWLGIVCIIIGVVFVSLSSKEKAIT